MGGAQTQMNRRGDSFVRGIIFGGNYNWSISIG